MLCARLEDQKVRMSGSLVFLSSSDIGDTARGHLMCNERMMLPTYSSRRRVACC